MTRIAILAGVLLAPVPTTPSPSAVASVSPSLTATPVTPTDLAPPTGVSQDPTLPVFVTDTARDFWDWILLLGGIASVVVGILAVALAYKANKAAERANAEATKARAAIAAERRRTFELEILRDLLEALDNPRMLHEFTEFGVSFKGTFGARLSLLPDDELPAWRGVAELVNMEALIDFLGARTAEYEEILKKRRRTGHDFRMPGLSERLKSRLHGDVEQAVERRMTERDD